MGDSLRKKDYGAVACFIRVVLAACIYWMGYDASPLWIVLMVLSVIGLCMAYGIRNKSCKVTVNGNQLSQKDAKNCTRKAYIYTIILIGNLCWIVALTSLHWDIEFALDSPWVAPLLVIICAILDIVFIKPKNLKYACKGYTNTGDNNAGDNYQKGPGGAVYDPEAQYGAQNMQQ